MTALGHAEAHERIADLALEPGALDRLGSPDLDPLAAHVATCRACRGEVRAWREMHRAVEAARGSGVDRIDLGELAAGDATDDDAAPPVGLRGSVLDAVRRLPAADGRIGGTDRPFETETETETEAETEAETDIVPEPAALESRRRVRLRRDRLARRLLPLVAVLGIVAVSAGLLVDQSVQIDRARQQTARLAALAVTV
ncbi:MAG TPA: hypothetical protein VLS28_00125, partial [Candidatus Sulfomarinibacteraceae bacterium]|nr:hypothetical protein [Candidatus Sulfomarinibacteraceae bacterium]